MLASSSKAKVSFLEETAYGVVETGAPKSLRMTGETLVYDIQSEESKEINDTRQVTDLVHVDASAQGGVNLEMQYREYDTFFEALLCSTFSSVGIDGVIALTDVTFDVAGGTITTIAGDFAALVDGQWVSIKGSTGNDGTYRIATVTALVLTVDAATPLVSDDAAETCDISGSRVTIGADTLRSFSVQKTFTDVGQFFMYTGMAASQFNLNLSTGSILSGDIGFMGAKGVRADATGFSQAATDSNPFGVMNAVTGVGRILVDGVPLAGTFAKSATVAVNANLRNQKGLGFLGAVGLGLGTYSVGGTLEIYLNDGSIYDKALANQEISFEFPVKDVAGNGYAFIFAKCKLGVPTVQSGSKDTDVMLSIPYTAVAPAAGDKVITIDRFGAAIA